MLYSKVGRGLAPAVLSSIIDRQNWVVFSAGASPRDDVCTKWNLSAVLFSLPRCEHGFVCGNSAVDTGGERSKARGNL